MGYGQNRHSKDLTPIFTENTDLENDKRKKSPGGDAGAFSNLSK
jgi:hypothetical protein